MKKYDIVLLALYAVVVALGYGLNRYVNHKGQELKAEVKLLVDNQEIRKVVIRDLLAKVDIFPTDEDDEDVWGLRGYVNQSNCNGLYIDDGVLHITNLPARRGYYLKLREGIPIEIENSPNVMRLSREELDRRRSKDNRTKWNYEF